MRPAHLPTKRVYCGNCGMYGHVFKRCTEPITSIGVIAVQRKKPDDRLRFLMIRRKHTLGYIEFMRGRYSLHDIKSIIRLFEQMIPAEVAKIRAPGATFDALWRDMWRTTHQTKAIRRDYVKSKKQWETLTAGAPPLNLAYIAETSEPMYTEPEWGFPKGRRNLHENNFRCALREFAEETAYDLKHLHVLGRRRTHEELFHGTDGNPYKHVYYVGHLKDSAPPARPSTREVGALAWFTLEEALERTRARHVERKAILSRVARELEDHPLPCHPQLTIVSPRVSDLAGTASAPGSPKSPASESTTSGYSTTSSPKQATTSPWAQVAARKRRGNVPSTFAPSTKASGGGRLPRCGPRATTAPARCASQRASRGGRWRRAWQSGADSPDTVACAVKS